MKNGHSHFHIHTFDFQRYFRYNGCRKLKEVKRLKQKHHLALTTEEWRMVIDSLSSMRNRLISAGRYTDAVDEVLIKVANAKVKKFRVAERRI